MMIVMPIWPLFIIVESNFFNMIRVTGQQTVQLVERRERERDKETSNIEKRRELKKGNSYM